MGPRFRRTDRSSVGWGKKMDEIARFVVSCPGICFIWWEQEVHKENDVREMHVLHFRKLIIYIRNNIPNTQDD